MAAIPTFHKLRPRHIRLLDLQPGEPGVPFQGKLREISLDNQITYEALSYTWGTPEQSSLLHCENSTIPLTLNLELALSRLRLVDKTRTLWIDQICINQSDIAERGQQVSLMGDIYRKSAVVIIWIGEEEEDTPLATAAIGLLMQCFTNSDGMEMSENENPRVIQHVGLLFVRSKSWIALRNMFERPYFRRMWIVQEAVLGKRCLVYCGSHVVAWDDMTKAALCLELDEDRQVEAHRVVQMIRRLRERTAHVPGRRLLDLLSQTYNLQCSNPRDKVYGLLGLASDIDVEELSPDYSLTCQEVYISMTKYCIRKYQSLAVLSCVRNPKTLSGLPSWVPDWNVVSAVGQCLQFRASEKYCAAGTTTRQYRFSPNGLVLYAWGRKMDTVKSLGAIMPGTKDSNLRDPVRQEWETLARTVSPYHTGELYPTILWRTIIADGQTRGSDSDEIRKRLFTASRYLTLRNRKMEDPKKFEDPGEPPEEMSIVNSRQIEFLALYDAASCGRRISITERRYLGLVPAETQIGDYLCIFSGMQVPFVLRQEPRSDQYSLIGECYIQGWMDGVLFGGSTSPMVEFFVC
jgi:hypothetical protein